MVAEGLAPVHIRQMDFDKGYGDGEQSVPQCHAGVGEGRRIDQDAVDALAKIGMGLDKMVRASRPRPAIDESGGYRPILWKDIRNQNRLSESKKRALELDK